MGRREEETGEIERERDAFCRKFTYILFSKSRKSTLYIYNIILIYSVGWCWIIWKNNKRRIFLKAQRKKILFSPYMQDVCVVVVVGREYFMIISPLFFIIPISESFLQSSTFFTRTHTHIQENFCFSLDNKNIIEKFYSRSIRYMRRGKYFMQINKQQIYLRALLNFCIDQAHECFL